MTPSPGSRRRARRYGQFAAARVARRPLVDGHAPKRQLSQSFLRDLDVRDAIVAAGGVQEGEWVLEIGPGLGVLTEGLLATGARVVAVELDHTLIPRLEERFADEIGRGALTLVQGDALQVDFAALVPAGATWRVIANIPYHITSPLLHRLLLLSNPATRIVLLVQLEVAQRVAAERGDWSYLTAFVQARARVQIVRKVMRNAFEPVPNVDSAVLVLDHRTGHEAFSLSSVDEERLWRLVQAGFRERRKKLRNALPSALPIPASTIFAALEAADLDPNLRAQALDVGDWRRLMEQLPELAPSLEPAPVRRYSTHGAAPKESLGRSGERSSDSHGDGWIELHAPGKINLTLAVLGRRQDGYHDLHSVVVPLEFGDRLSMGLADGANIDELRLGGLPVDVASENLILVALRELRSVVALPPLRIVLEKRIPVAAGLGGGSSDAAAALRGGLQLANVTLATDRLLEVAARVGSDVPLFLANGPVLIEGRGERITPLAALAPPAAGVLLVTPGVPLQTRDVFAAFAAGARDPLLASALSSSRHLAEEMRRPLSVAQLVQRSAALAAANELLAPARAVAPWLRPFGQALGRLLGRPVALSGSGPTLFVLYPSRSEAEVAAATVAAALREQQLAAPEGGAVSVIATVIATKTNEEEAT